MLVNNARRLRRDSGKPEAAGHMPFWAVDPVLYRETVEVNVAGTFLSGRPGSNRRRPAWEFGIEYNVFLFCGNNLVDLFCAGTLLPNLSNFN